MYSNNNQHVKYKSNMMIKANLWAYLQSKVSLKYMVILFQTYVENHITSEIFHGLQFVLYTCRTEWSTRSAFKNYFSNDAPNLDLKKFGLTNQNAKDL